VKTKHKLFCENWGRILAMLAAVGCQGVASRAECGSQAARVSTRTVAWTTAYAPHIVMRDAASDRLLIGEAELQKPAPSRSVQSPAANTRSVPPRRSTSRLPAHYGKLGISGDQRTTIYEIQASYGDQIDDLELKIRGLRDKQQQEVESVLSSEQQLELKRFRAAAAKKQAERRQRSSKRRSNED
jgi:hypothetical protein